MDLPFRMPAQSDCSQGHNIQFLWRFFLCPSDRPGPCRPRQRVPAHLPAASRGIRPHRQPSQRRGQPSNRASRARPPNSTRPIRSKEYRQGNDRRPHLALLPETDLRAHSDFEGYPQGIALRAEREDTRDMAEAPRGFRSLPTLARFVIAGTVICALIGAVVGLILGLIAYPPTAWAAVIEVGYPSAFTGAVIGLVVGFAVNIRRHVRRAPDAKAEFGETHRS
jgi:hypothetical protein